VTYTDNLESAPIWRKWCAISTIAAVLERKVWVTTSSPLYPTLYTIIVGDAGLGKTRPIMAAKGLIKELPEHVPFAPTSVTMASLVDAMLEAKRKIIRLPHGMIEYNSLYIMSDELSAFMHEYAGDLIAGLTTFYDGVPYSQTRRVGKIDINIDAPQLNILCGSTPSNLTGKIIPENAWEQGFMSRVILVYSDERPLIDVFNIAKKEKPVDLIHDLRLINALHGEFGWDKEFAEYMHKWKKMGLEPKPQHPKLATYNSRRFAHVIKLAMVSNVDRGGDLHLTKQDFNKAMEWILEAEERMPLIFKAGPGGADSRAIEEILFFIRQHPNGIEEHKIMNYARQHLEYSTNVIRTIELMEKSDLIYKAAFDTERLVNLWKARSTH
jgi:hypothetical protein